MNANLQPGTQLNINELTVNGYDLLDDADTHGEAFAVRYALFTIMYKRPPSIDEYASLDTLDGPQALRALEHVEQDISAAKDHLLRVIAEQYVLPQLASMFGEQDTIYGDALNLINVFSSWRTGHAPAEVYGRTSLVFRIKYQMHPSDEISNIEALLNALPSCGVDRAAYFGMSPADHWMSFGEHLAQFSDAGIALEDVRIALGERDPDDASAPDYGWYHLAFVDALTKIGREKLLDHDETLKAQILTALTLYPAA